jgi:hypothetical protein
MFINEGFAFEPKFQERHMQNNVIRLRSIAPARHKPAPAAGHFGFLKSEFARPRRDEIDFDAFSRNYLQIAA